MSTEYSIRKQDSGLDQFEHDEECENIRDRIGFLAKEKEATLNILHDEHVNTPQNGDTVNRLFADIPVHDHKNKVAEYQRVNISSDGVLISDEMSKAANKLLWALETREKYVYRREKSNWGGIDPVHFEQKVKESYDFAEKQGHTMYRRRLEPPFEPFNQNMFCTRTCVEELGHDLTYTLDDGVAKVFQAQADGSPCGENLYEVISQDQYYADLVKLVNFSHEAASKSFCFKRLELLDAKFNLHVLLNAEKENAEKKAVPHRDFYNVRKVDTHIHHSAIMNQKHLLRFIKHKLKRCPNEVVAFRDEKHLTLEQVFRSLHLTAYDLSIDTLDMHADNTFHRFDRFNLKYNPIGESRLREIFLKSDNLIAGRYLAEITQEVFDDAEANKYVLMEPRISIYGRNIMEWSKLGKWYCRNKLSSPTIRWMIQIPRLYSIYKSMNLITSFQDVINNIFKPLFDVTLDPNSDVELDTFLQQVVGFDCVDDESKFDRSATLHNHPEPQNWTSDDNPPYSYWIYYIYANLKVLNSLRERLGKTTFAFRPHCGEAGDVNNLASAFLCAESINHGIMLRKLPTMQYLYYLSQIGLAVSPLSNNKLFLDYQANPFPIFFARGMNVSLSTDDPLMLHITKDPLVEEYSVASQVWKLSSTDMCEIARNSVLQSGFEHPYKVHFIGENYEKCGPAGNDIKQTNVPDIRVLYRRETLDAEWDFIRNCSTEK